MISGSNGVIEGCGVVLVMVVVVVVVVLEAMMRLLYSKKSIMG